ncbi:hypothetical protein A2833_03500 [Candidatus Azambacteria bacterium RIFCSPHIGHO2_01_FULL_44_55]|uniref:Ribosomal RNA large subunit methyltransferase E n=1 Tax=Candidatus Azambacteria bacterium RIFCSPLOWO2_02_FULL_44_14 TaxID=1797306 RepID=A0A1F5CBV5_9BACT|nr:MAG: hypothetical protein A3A18_03055 [Candidatus Azambacteria bacterium RIFCSPLOWO2_01_FULL_44_84]OGD33680.1 MAG: hypothetical protein A3C78_01165 [Candidatus Azambacteria bacterium RIFCSPHIGHO2_02_FULL_45_18]OGD40371.1 MAG: hypothetical protein A3I30_03740 [Candidatus Azambacteria bacterium RIFCSPLOWO2_02_FULL_44_14]OGD40815.1 MAG: hypothetical protein A2833_03500 [Candidatus Azambacteria bacterium RIFCSPHIGHO2_01_FULL_44_55]OGD52219.1 MAG: hypothetical protein A2608_02170 [Candidatus Azam
MLIQVAYEPDKWAKRAKEEGYLARSAYKLLALDREFHVFRRGDLVLDLGSAPGSWVQVALKKIGERGFVIGVDLEPAKVGTSVNFAFLRKDIYDADLESELKKIIKKPFDAVLSDVAPNTTGQKDVDQWRSHELTLRVFGIVKNELKKNGTAVVKVFEGPDTPEIILLFKESFKRVSMVKPEASIKGSKEVYIVAKGFKSIFT